MYISAAISLHKIICVIFILIKFILLLLFSHINQISGKYVLVAVDFYLTGLSTVQYLPMCTKLMYLSLRKCAIRKGLNSSIRIFTIRGYQLTSSSKKFLRIFSKIHLKTMISKALLNATNMSINNTGYRAVDGIKIIPIFVNYCYIYKKVDVYLSLRKSTNDELYGCLALRS